MENKKNKKIKYAKNSDKERKNFFLLQSAKYFYKWCARDMAIQQ